MLFSADPDPSWDTSPKVFVRMSWRSMRKKWMASTNLPLIQRLSSFSFLSSTLSRTGLTFLESTTTQMS